MNIFIVEDEPWALEEMIDILGIYKRTHQVFAFPSGDDALAESIRVKPDLVITDIRMPGIDGLKLIEELKTQNPDVQGIVLSGYDEFTYARKGLRIGIKDYLLKPVMPEQLFDSIDRVLALIDELYEKKNNIRKWSLSRILLDATATTTREEQDFLNQTLGMVLLICGNQESLRTWSEVEASLPSDEKSIYPFTSFSGEIVLEMDPHRKVILFPVDGSITLRGIKNEVEKLFEMFVRSGETIHATYSVKAAGESISTTFKAAQKHLEQHMRLQYSTFAEPGVEVIPMDLKEVWDQVRILEQNMKNGDIPKVQGEAKQIIEKLKKMQITIYQLNEFLTDLLYGFQFNLNLSFQPNKMSYSDEINKRLKRATHYDEILEWILEILVSLTKSNQLEQYSPKLIVHSLIEFIDKNYNKGISLQEFSSTYHISIGYLSRLFKSETGLNFSQYLTEIRLTKAKEILQKGQYKLSDVSALVGYEDPKYFSQQFKKATGVSPTEFQKKAN